MATQGDTATLGFLLHKILPKGVTEILLHTKDGKRYVLEKQSTHLWTVKAIYNV